MAICPRLTGLSTTTATTRIAVGTKHSCRHSQLSSATLSLSVNGKVGELFYIPKIR
jgi:hypothetical protein